MDIAIGLMEAYFDVEKLSSLLADKLVLQNEVVFPIFSIEVFLLLIIVSLLFL